MGDIRRHCDVIVTHGLVDVLIMFHQHPLWPHVLLCPAVQNKTVKWDNTLTQRWHFSLVMTTENYVHVLEHVRAEGRVNFLPATQVSRSLVKQVAVSRWQQVPHQDDRRTDRDQDEEFTGPALVHVLCTLRETYCCYSKKLNGQRQTQAPDQGCPHCLGSGVAVEMTRLNWQYNTTDLQSKC